MKNVLKLLIVGWLRIPYSHLDSDDCHPDDVITRDIAVIGGGSTGTYSAIRLRDLGKIWHDLELVKKYFVRFNIPLTKADFSVPGTTVYVDYRTGKEVGHYRPKNVTSSLIGYATQLARYPYVEDGFNLPVSVPADLLLPFGDFVKKYALEDLVGFLFGFGQGLGDLLHQPTLYVFKNFGSDLIRDLQLAISKDYAKILIRAKKIVFTIPPKIYNLRSFDLDRTERTLFAQFGNSGYYTGLLRNTGISGNVTITNVGADTLYNLPALPGIYSLSQTGVPGLISVKYGSALGLPDDQVMADIISKVKLLHPASTPEFAIFSSHTTFELTAGFYRKLCALQGHKRTWYTGAAFHTHDSSLLWEFTEELLPRIVASFWDGAFDQYCSE
ncbi:hypothetical protein V1504DRAFT_442467 [Lipomyces starkeyi]